MSTTLTCKICDSTENVDDYTNICADCIKKNGGKCVHCQEYVYRDELKLCDKCKEFKAECIKCKQPFGVHDHERYCNNCFQRIKHRKSPYSSYPHAKKQKRFFCKCCKEPYTEPNEFKCCPNCYKLHVYECKACQTKEFKRNPSEPRCLCDKCYYSGQYHICKSCKLEITEKPNSICKKCLEASKKNKRSAKLCRVCGKKPSINAGCCEDCSKEHTFVCIKCGQTKFKKDPKENRLQCLDCK